jgi:hypothetical protein
MHIKVGTTSSIFSDLPGVCFLSINYLDVDC